MNDQKIKILMIDDDPILTQLYETKATRHEEIEFMAVDNTVDGERVALEKNPDVILLDLFLGKEPGMNVPWVDKNPSFQFLMKHKDHPLLQNIPVIILSNLDSKEDHDKAKELGAAYSILKVDMTPEKVLEKVKALISNI